MNWSKALLLKGELLLCDEAQRKYEQKTILFIIDVSWLKISFYDINNRH